MIVGHTSRVVDFDEQCRGYPTPCPILDFGDHHVVEPGHRPSPTKAAIAATFSAGEKGIWGIGTYGNASKPRIGPRSWGA